MTRIEQDLLGSMELPDDVLYGIQTARSIRHLNVSGVPLRSDIVHAMAEVKLACAMANRECGYLSPSVADAIITACGEIIGGKHASHFVVDALQGGAGTSTNMNLNEVIARRAHQLSGMTVHPLEHVNLHQSTNDVYPTAVKVAALHSLPFLEQAIIGLQEAYQVKEREFADIVKMGRTQLRDAVPLTLGREFGACASALARDRWRIFKCSERLRVVNLGGTAIGTGITAPRLYIFCVIEKLREITRLPLSRAENLVDMTQNQDCFVEVSGILRVHAANLVKFSRDLRLLSSGPQGGLGEIELPPIQPGSTIMPGKINPVIPEMVTQAAYRVFAHDYEINMGVMSGELELNAFLPLIADALLNTIHLLEQSDKALAVDCIHGISANAEHCRLLAEQSPEMVTALIPRIGHERAIELSRLMREHQWTIRQAVKAMGCLSEKELESLLNPHSLCALGSELPEPTNRNSTHATNT